jgi:pyrroline-5-carboxylate reductase
LKKEKMKVNQNIVIFGIGAMGSALVKSWITSKLIQPARITAADVDEAKCKQMAARYKIKVATDGLKALKSAGLVILAVKPQQMKELLVRVGPQIPKKALVISIAAGVSTGQLERALAQGCPIVRVMPNTPALLGAGMAAVAKGSRAKSGHVKLVLNLFSAMGKAIEVTEDKMDLVTGLSGSGPAYVFRMVEAMTSAGVKGGLSGDTAFLLAAQTVYGAGRMMLETGKSPEELRVQVTSPGGTTQAGLKALDVRGFKETLEAAITAATDRSVELRRMNQ